jgi:hypothetical protein
MILDIATAKEAGGVAKKGWSAVKWLFNWRRKHFENKIDVDVASYDGAVRVDTLSSAPAIGIMLKVCNFSPLFRGKIENITASVIFKNGNDWINVIQDETIVIAENLPRSGFKLVPCRFKLTDAQIRSLDKCQSNSIINVRVDVRIAISSSSFSVIRCMPNTDVLVRPWPKRTND